MMTVFDRLIRFVRYDPLLEAINDAIVTWLNPFRPSEVSKRFLAFTTLTVRFEIFLKLLLISTKIHLLATNIRDSKLLGK
jgi:hypothetical protein